MKDRSPADMKSFSFTLLAKDGAARRGRIETSRGPVDTPAFMPVGTLGTVKALSPEDIAGSGAQILLGNTYHLYLRPGCEVIGDFGGLHRFMGWSRPVLTDSGGFQVFSLAALQKITDQGVSFRSHINGSLHDLTPEKAVEIQAVLDSDIAMCLDECIPFPADEARAQKAMERTHAWAVRSREEAARRFSERNALFAIAQGGMYPDLRRRSAEELAGLDFPGYAAGGLSVGEPRGLMMEMAAVSASALPEHKPRYAMGIGRPEDLVDMVQLGFDMFDCVMPTRNARNGQLFTASGTLNIANACHTKDHAPVEEGCSCLACRSFSRAYLRHLFMSREILFYRLATLHNVTYYQRLMASMREAIGRGRFSAFVDEFRTLQKGL
ncbi:MAG: tRNA guanosine(34) transglycosylase Tgt [Thermodesulfobacteriota bacterium]